VVGAGQNLVNRRDKGQTKVERKRDQRRRYEYIIIFAKVNQRKKRKTVTCLENNGVMLTETKDMLEHALDFYKTLFGKEERNNIRL
jgi:hypothetical protein